MAYSAQEENHGCSTAQLPAPGMCCDGVQSIPQPGHTHGLSSAPAHPGNTAQQHSGVRDISPE